MILVTGATGTIGRPLVEALVAEGVEVRAITRNPGTADLPDKVDLIEGDPSRPETVAPFLRGVTALFLHPAAIGAAAGELITLARDNGVKRVVLLSALAVEEPAMAELSITHEHKELEDALTGGGLEWVILRPGMFATNTIMQWGAQLRAGDVVRSPYAASTDSPIHEEDVAAVAVRALLEDGLVGKRLALTGPQSLTRQEMVAAIADVTGRPIQYQEIPAEVAKQGMLAHGLPEAMVDTALALWAGSVGQTATVTTGVQDVLGRPARTFAQWVADHVEAFTA